MLQKALARKEEGGIMRVLVKQEVASARSESLRFRAV